jgi:hypothetical protein
MHTLASAHMPEAKLGVVGNSATTHKLSSALAPRKTLTDNTNTHQGLATN